MRPGEVQIARSLCRPADLRNESAFSGAERMKTPDAEDIRVLKKLKKAVGKTMNQFTLQTPCVNGDPVWERIAGDSDLG
ncbi:hypothetical protein H920_13200 [Fukomys damarensis]|uniref:Uncharacterized protein n=1 Tax=Fukomys damarensis TaxID=885580 RepID=A0A091D025_FUKDA|nr:hypothetical protein H920_13200 [Fukomys damarensis]